MGVVFAALAASGAIKIVVATGIDVVAVTFPVSVAIIAVVVDVVFDIDFVVSIIVIAIVFSNDTMLMQEGLED